YQPGKPSVTEVSFIAEAGQTVAILGPTGSGKTTLVNLIPRFYEVSSGRVLIEGTDVREIKLEQLRRSIGVIFQETFLFSATVAVAHRMSTVHHADLILVLREGRIVEQGTHGELSGRSGFYRDVYEEQVQMA